MASEHPTMIPLEELVRACKRGDEGSREQLVRRYQRIAEIHVISLLHQYGCSSMISAHLHDILQQIWTELFNRIDKFPPEEFESWFAFLRKWITFDYIRVELTYLVRHPGKLDTRPDSKVSSTDPIDTPETRSMTRELRLKVRKILDKLPTKQQQFIRLYYFQDVSYPEIAQRLGVQVTSVGSLHTRAVKNLKKRLKKKGKNIALLFYFITI